MKEKLNKNSLIVGTISAWSIFAILLIYIPVTILGKLSLKSPLDPIGDPYFTIMEMLILVTAPLLVICMSAVCVNSKEKDKIYSLISLIFMTILATITSSVHFIIMTVSHQIESLGFAGAKLLFSFSWPSVVYTLDILAWDWFFALSMIFAAFIFHETKLERLLRIIMIISGVVSLFGLVGVPLANMEIRNIGIIGYSIIAAIAFFIMGIVFKKKIKSDQSILIQP